MLIVCTHAHAKSFICDCYFGPVGFKIKRQNLETEKNDCYDDNSASNVSKTIISMTGCQRIRVISLVTHAWKNDNIRRR